ncbi:hypothetical protein Tco_0088180 [Tanacetum coccineum]
MLAICSAAKLVVFKAPKPSSNAEKATKGGSSKAPTGSKTGHLKRNKDSISTVESNPSLTLASTPVVTEMHKEDQQETGGPNSLGVTSKERADPQLNSGDDASANSTAKADPRKSAPSTDPHVLANQTQSVSEGLESILTQSTTDKGANNIAKQIKEVEASRIIKLEDLAKLIKNVQPSFKDLNSPEDDPIIVVNDSDEDEEADKDGIHATSNIETEDASVHKSLSPRSFQIQELTNQLNELLVKSLQTEFSKILYAHDFSSSLPTELKELPSKFNELTEVILPKPVTSLTSKVAELKTLQWELPTEFLSMPTQVETVQAKLKTLDALPSLLNKVANALNQFAQAIASKKTKDASVFLAGQAGTQPAEGEKNINQTTISHDFDDDETHLTSSMVESSKIKKVKKFDFVIEEMVNKYYNDKLQYNRYCDKMLRRAESRITNCDVLTKKGLITLKVYIEDGTSKVIPNLKASDLHLVRSRMDYIHTTEAEMGINLDIPPSKQDPLDKLNDLANKKRKHADDIHDYFKENKRLKSSVYGSETEDGLCKELQFILVDNSKLNVVYLLNRRLKHFVSLLEGLQGGKRIALCQKE